MKTIDKKWLKSIVEDVTYGIHDRPAPVISDDGKTVQPEFPVLPVNTSPHVASQLSHEVPPVDDEDYVPNTIDDLSKSAAELAKRIPRSEIENFYHLLKRHTNKYEDVLDSEAAIDLLNKDGKMSLGNLSERNLRKMIRRVLKETTDDDKVDHRARRQQIIDREKAKAQARKRLGRSHGIISSDDLDRNVHQFDFESNKEFNLNEREVVPIRFDEYKNIYNMEQEFFSEKNDIDQIKIARLIDIMGFPRPNITETSDDLKYPFTFFKVKSKMRGNTEFGVEDLDGNIAVLPIYSLTTSNFSFPIDHAYGPAFEKLKSKPREKVKSKDIAKAIILANSDYKTRDFDKEEDASVFRNLQNVTGHKYESGTRQAINSLMEKVRLLKIIYHNPKSSVKKQETLTYFYRHLDRLFRDPSLRNRMQEHGAYLTQELYAYAINQAFRRYIRPIVNNKIKFLVQSGKLVKFEKGRAESEEYSGDDYTFMNQLIRVLLGQDINVELIRSKWPNPEEIVKMLAKVADDIVRDLDSQNIIDNFWNGLKQEIQDMDEDTVIGVLESSIAEENWLDSIKDTPDQMQTYVKALNYLRDVTTEEDDEDDEEEDEDDEDEYEEESDFDSEANKYGFVQR
jgi:hypothetical protein